MWTAQNGQFEIDDITLTVRRATIVCDVLGASLSALGRGVMVLRRRSHCASPGRARVLAVVMSVLMLTTGCDKEVSGRGSAETSTASATLTALLAVFQEGYQPEDRLPALVRDDLDLFYGKLETRLVATRKGEDRWYAAIKGDMVCVLHVSDTGATDTVGGASSCVTIEWVLGQRHMILGTGVTTLGILMLDGCELVSDSPDVVVRTTNFAVGHAGDEPPTPLLADLACDGYPTVPFTWDWPRPR